LPAGQIWPVEKGAVLSFGTRDADLGLVSGKTAVKPGHIIRGDTLGAPAGFRRADGDDSGQAPNSRGSGGLTRVAVMQPADQG
jgi:hypothetical protein